MGASSNAAPITHETFILPALVPPRRHDLSLLILADGNRRSAAEGGYGRGARRIVAVAEHLARRPDVAVMGACILSPENLAKRGEGFFHALYQEFVRLGVEIEVSGALVAAGVRVELRGDLGGLRARGGHAAALADAAEAVAAMTVRVSRPDLFLRLVLIPGYGSDTADALDTDILLRTGMEEENALRLSGLRTRPHIANHATTTLWPDITLREIDEVIELAGRRAAPRLAPGHAPEAVVELAAALARADLDVPVRATIAASGPPAAMEAAIERLYAGPLRGSDALAVEHAADEAGAPRRHGPGGARHELCVVHGARVRGEPVSVLAPGQEPPSFTLPSSLPAGYANVHGCEATAPGIVAGVRAALRFAAAHPPLLGRDRAIVAGAAADPDDPGDRFAASLLDWASSAGILLPDAAWRTAARNYALTGFFIHFRVPAAWDPAAERWRERAELAAKYMLLVAAGDEGIFDRVVDGETAEQRLHRLEASSRFLRGATPGAEPPPVPGAELLAAIAAGWREILASTGSCLPEAAESFRAGLERLYVASVAEHRVLAAPDWLARLLEGRPIVREVEDRCAAAPPSIAARARALAERAAVEGPHAIAGELRALLHLVEVGSAVGAGLLFRAAALQAPAASVTRRSIAVLDEVTALLDYPFRLANDLSGFLDAAGGDRDPKQNTCSILVPAQAAGPAREAAVIAALATCRRLSTWLAGELHGEIARLAAEWPWMGEIVRRGVLVGRRVYEVGHYTTVTRAGMREVFDEAQNEARGRTAAAPTGPFAAPIEPPAVRPRSSA